MKREYLLALGFSLLIGWLSLSTVFPAIASPDKVKWSRVTIPTQGRDGGWVLASGSDIKHPAVSSDGTIYAYANPTTANYTLFKSTNAGYSWTDTGNVTDSIVDIAAPPNEADVICYATASAIYKSDDGGSSFSELPALDRAGSNNIEITSIAIAPQDNGYLIAIATRDTDTSEFGGVYLLDENELIPTWQDTNLTGFDVCALAFSPNYPTDYQLVAVVSDENDTVVTSKVGDAAWGATFGNATLDRDNSATSVVAISADIALPSDYDASSEDRSLLVAIDTGTGNGDVYQIDLVDAPANSIATDLNIGDDYGLSNIDVTSLAISGKGATADLLAGAAGSAQVYFSTYGGDQWSRSAKPPTGESHTYVLVDSNGRAYAATSGSESALSMTEDFTNWNQVGLIDTEITSIVDRAPYPTYGEEDDSEIRSDTLFMLTHGGTHSLWRSLDEGASWERVFSSALPNVDSINLVELPPQYGNGNRVVFLAGTWNGEPTIWKSNNNGQNFVYRLTHDPDTGDAFNIDTWAVTDDDTLFIGSFDDEDEKGLVYYTTNSGLNYSTPTIVGEYSLSSIILSPNYEHDETILVSNVDDRVYWSNDNGVSFKSIPANATSRPLTRSIDIAFDPEFGSNNTVYVLNKTADKSKDIEKGIYHFVINQSTEWVYTLTTNTPTLVGPESDFMVKVNQITGEIAEEVMLTWKRPSDEVTKYDLWIANDSTFDQVVVEVSVEDTATRVNAVTGPQADITLYFTPGTTYFWKVRVASDYPFKCPWSATRQFAIEKLKSAETVVIQISPPPEITVKIPPLEIIVPPMVRISPVEPTAPTLPPWTAVAIGITTIAALIFLIRLAYQPVTPHLRSPKDRATGVATKPILRWSAVAGAKGYELLVSTNSALAHPRIIKTGTHALPDTTWWRCNVTLDGNTTYYWKVRAIGASSNSEWSSAGQFTTESPTSLSSPPPGHATHSSRLQES